METQCDVNNRDEKSFRMNHCSLGSDDDDTHHHDHPKSMPKSRSKTRSKTFSSSSSSYTILLLSIIGTTTILSSNYVSASSTTMNAVSLGVRSAIVSSSSRSKQFFGASPTSSSSSSFCRKNGNGRRAFRRTTSLECDLGTVTDTNNSRIAQCVSTSQTVGTSTLETRRSDKNTITASTSTSASTSLNDISNSLTQSGARGGAGAVAAVSPVRGLLFWENMICGAISRSMAQIITHPANTMKTMLQSNREAATNKMTIRTLARPKNLKVLTRGAGAQFVLSVPHGAVNFAVLEFVRNKLNHAASQSEWARTKQKTSAAFSPMLDFVSSALATICCSVVSTPQMMILDNIMAGTYPNLKAAVVGLSQEKGIAGFYTGWWPGLAGKIPSYALTWTLFQQLKLAQLRIYDRPPRDIENSIMGCLASTTSVCIMIPMDTIKTRLVTQMNYPDLVPYKGIIDAAFRIGKEEGIGAFYRGLPPRLFSVVPMIGIQFGVYEFMKKVMLSRDVGSDPMQVMMEVAADDDQPFPAPALGSSSGYGEKETKKRKGRKKSRN